MDMESIEKYTSVSVLTVFATIRGWIGWLIVLYCVAMCTDWLTGTILAIKTQSGILVKHAKDYGINAALSFVLLWLC